MKDAHNAVSKPPYTYVAKGLYWRFRHPGFGETSLPGKPGENAFEEKYARLLEQVQRTDPIKTRNARGTFAFVIEKYFADYEYKILAKGTKSQYERYAAHILPLLGDIDMTACTTEMVAEVRNTTTPGSADNLRRFISRLYEFANPRGYVEAGVNRARGLKSVRPKSAGVVPWSDDEIELLLENATGDIRTLIIIGLTTGQRPGDCVGMEWSQVLRNNVRVWQVKTRTLIDIPMHPMLREELDRVRVGSKVEGTIVKRRSGQPLKTSGYAYRLRVLVRSIPNMPPRTPHGARYATAALLEDAGCTVQMIQAILGHTTYEMAMQYLTRRKEASTGMAKMIAAAAKRASRRKPKGGSSV